MEECHYIIRCDVLRLFTHLFVVTYCLLVLVDSSSVVVESPFGKIQGVKKTDEKTGVSYLSFQGIPYAKPPLGDLRFAKPQPHPHIDDTFDATKEDLVVCPHPDSFQYGFTQFTEDCLILNIQMKDDIYKSKTRKKVIVYIHGGGFFFGTSQAHDTKSFIISQDVIAVTINYRLGILGFLSTENKASPGNYGLWDQRLAIKWVKDNIHAFGGDPDDITIAGESAGGASVGYQILSPHTKGLFTKAIQLSGTATSVFVRTSNAINDALTVAKATGCLEKDTQTKITFQESKALVKCLRNVPLAALTSQRISDMTKTKFVPRVDEDFVPDIPLKLLEDIDYLNSIEFFDRSHFISIVNNEVQLMDVFTELSTKDITIDHDLQLDDKESAVQNKLKNLKDMYLLSRLGEFASDKTILSTIDDFYDRRFINSSVLHEMMSDLNFLVPSWDFLSAASKHPSCNSYFLYFNHFPKFMRGTTRGMLHGVNLAYMFDISISEKEELNNAGMQGKLFDEQDEELKRLYSSIIGEFVKTRNPGQALKSVLPSGWPTYDVTNSYYLNFNPKPWVSSFLEKDRQDLWLKTVPSLKRNYQRHSEL